MKKHFSSAVCMAALLLIAGAATDVNFSPAVAQDVQINFDTFHRQLSPYGDWVYSDRWGEVWIPTDVQDDFHPYGTSGHWVYTDDYGWYWASDYEWGDIPFHYGRWVNDPDDGWLWIPGYVWSPAWVAWRHNGRYTGWMPLPPDDAFLGRGRPRVGFGINVGGLSISFGSEDDDYGYSRWYGPGYGRDYYAQNWVFVGTGHVADHDFGRYLAPRNNYARLIRNTTNITNYTVVNNYVVNRSVDPRAVRQAGGQFQPVKAATVMKRPQFVMRADAGAQLQNQARADRPRGTGFANSAPKPSASVVQSLSTKAPPARGGHPPMHLFTRDTVMNAPLAPAGAKPGAPPVPSAAPLSAKATGETGPKPGPAMNGPPGAPKHEDHMAPPSGAPAANGPANPPEGPKHEDRMTPPSASSANGPANSPEEPKHERMRDHAAPPSTMAPPAMTGPKTEPKPEEHVAPPSPAPAASGPPAPLEAPKHERMREHAPPPEAPKAAPPEAPKAAPPERPAPSNAAPPPNKPEKEHGKPKKPDDQPPH